MPATSPLSRKVRMAPIGQLNSFLTATRVRTLTLAWHSCPAALDPVRGRSSPTMGACSIIRRPPLLDRSYSRSRMGPTRPSFRAQGFTELGSSPGISGDGRIVVFSGNRGRGPGIFASYETGGSRKIVRIAGESDLEGPLDGFVSFDADSAIRVNDTLVKERGVTIAFEGVNATLGRGIYTARLSFFPSIASQFDPDNPADPSNPNSVQVSGIVPVAQIGDMLEPGVKIADLEFWDGINDINRGTIAFWAKLDNGGEAIVRATSMQVVWINFDPVGHSFGGQTSANLSLLQEVGVANEMGANTWSGSMQTTLQKLGLSTDYVAFQNNIVDEVQTLFSDAGVDVRVLGRTSDTPPVYVPNPVTDAEGDRYYQNGSVVARGAFQTIFVGGGPDGNDLGLASPTYAGAGALDFFNEIYDDTAVVLVNNVFQPANFGGKSITQLSDDERVRAVAFTIAHEAGHNYGLFHLDPSLTDLIMHGGTTAGEFDAGQSFGPGFWQVQLVDPSLQGVMEDDDARLNFAVGSLKGRDLDANWLPNPALLNLTSKDIRAKLGPNLTGDPITVHGLVIGVKSLGQGDLFPIFQDLGGGDLATLLANADIPVTALDSLILLGSTTGAKLDIIGVAMGQEGAQHSIAATALGVAADDRLLSPVTGDATGFHLYQLTSGGSIDLGVVSVQALAPNHSPILASIANKTVDAGTAVTFTASATDPDAGQHLTYSLDPGTPIGASIDPASGQFTWTPGSALGGQSVSVTLRVTDDGSPAASAARTFVINVTNRLQVTNVTWIDPPTVGALQVAIDFNEALQPASAQNVAIFHISRDGGTALPISSAAYSDNGAKHRVILTVPAGTSIPPAQYNVTIDGD